MSEWDGIKGHVGWSAKLKELLADAEKAAAGTELEPRFEVRRRLTEFIENSRPNDATVDAMDEIARLTAVGLMGLTIEERVAAIASRTGELALLTKQLQTAAKEAEAEASAIRLESARKAVDDLTTAVKSVRDLAASAKQGTAAEVVAKLQEVLEALETLRGDLDGSA